MVITVKEITAALPSASDAALTDIWQLVKGAIDGGKHAGNDLRILRAIRAACLEEMGQRCAREFELAEAKAAALLTDTGYENAPR